MSNSKKKYGKAKIHVSEDDKMFVTVDGHVLDDREMVELQAYLDREKEQKEFESIFGSQIKKSGGRPKGKTKRTIDRYKKVFHQFEILKKKYSSKTKAELYELLATKDYDGITYSRKTIRNIIEDKKYNLIPSQ